MKRLNPDAQLQGQGELFSIYHYHCAFTDSPLTLVDAEEDHRRHAVVEQVIADVRSGPLAHMPSGDFQANAVWLALAAIIHNLMRATGTLASAFHTKATTSTLRAQLICVPTRIARGARRSACPRGPKTCAHVEKLGIPATAARLPTTNRPEIR